MNRDVINRTAKLVMEALARDGKVVEGGFGACLRATFPPPSSYPSGEQLRQLRMFFFAGAQHVFATMTGLMSEDREPTEADIEVMDAISRELDFFIAEFARDYIATKGRA